MRDAGYISTGFVLTFGAVAVYAASVRARLRAARRALALARAQRPDRRP